MLIPDIEDEDSAPFWQATARGELRVQSCGACGRMRHPPRPMCPHCHSLQVEWRLLSGRATLWSFVVVHPPVLPDYAELAPYPVIVAALVEDEELRMVGNVVSAADAPINSVDPAALAIGQPLRVAFAEVDGVYLPRWIPE